MDVGPASAREHYDAHLAPVYAWMCGGIDAAVARGAAGLAELGLLDPAPRYAVDLGAGFGAHTIPLARAGCRVLAVDASAVLLDELRRNAAGLTATAARDDLLGFARHLEGAPELVLCMGDTLAHLPDRAAVSALFDEVARCLGPTGRFVLTFRDTTRALEGADRFIHVHSDASRIAVCFLEYEADAVLVHDVLHERAGDEWSTRVRAYRKLRLDPTWVRAQLEARGWTVRADVDRSGMVRMATVAPPRAAGAGQPRPAGHPTTSGDRVPQAAAGETSVRAASSARR